MMATWLSSLFLLKIIDFNSVFMPAILIEGADWRLIFVRIWYSSGDVEETNWNIYI